MESYFLNTNTLILKLTYHSYCLVFNIYSSGPFSKGRKLSFWKIIVPWGSFSTEGYANFICFLLRKIWNWSFVLENFTMVRALAVFSLWRGWISFASIYQYEILPLTKMGWQFYRALGGLKFSPTLAWLREMESITFSTLLGNKEQSFLEFLCLLEVNPSRPVHFWKLYWNKN